MDKPKSSPQQLGATRGKLIAIAVLAVVLLGVLYKQFGGSPAKPVQPEVPQSAAVEQEPSARPAARAARRGKSASPVAETIAAVTAPVRLQSIDKEAWKPRNLATVIQYDPFALPAKFPQPVAVAKGNSANGDESSLADADASRLADTVAKLQTELEQLKQQGVHVIVLERDQYVALIGDRTIHVGDEIGNGFTVTAIRPDGVFVERKVQP